MKYKIMLIALITSICLSISACRSISVADNSNKNTNPNATKIATAKINVQLGMNYLEQQNIPRAKLKFLLALDQAPNIPDTWYSMAYFLETTGDLVKAKEYYLKALALDSTKGDVQNNFGTFLCRQGEYHAAIQHFELAAKDINYIDTASAYENAGLCSLKIPDKKAALKFFNLANERDPEKVSVYLDLAQLHYSLGNIDKSSINLREFLALSSPTPESIELKQLLQKQKGNV